MCKALLGKCKDLYEPRGGSINEGHVKNIEGCVGKGVEDFGENKDSPSY
jgi:hypothetical protein